MKELLKSWKRSYKALESNPMNLDPEISAGYLACLELCIQQLEEALGETNDSDEKVVDYFNTKRGL